MIETGEVKLPIAETFHSLQGEGQWVGTPMFFIRLAGCPVGRPATAVKAVEPLPILPTGTKAMACATWDGRGFWCDTDYNKHSEETIESLVKQTWEKHICLTGGEPLIHQAKLPNLVYHCAGRGIRVHIETSGTVELTKGVGRSKIWITCAPKINALDRMIKISDELKLLVDARFHPDELTEAMKSHPNVFLCPVNDISDVKSENVEKAYMWLRQFPNWRLSFQAHKYWKMP